MGDSREDGMVSVPAESSVSSGSFGQIQLHRVSGEVSLGYGIQRVWEGGEWDMSSVVILTDSLEVQSHPCPTVEEFSRLPVNFFFQLSKVLN